MTKRALLPGPVKRPDLDISVYSPLDYHRKRDDISTMDPADYWEIMEDYVETEAPD